MRDLSPRQRSVVRLVGGGMTYKAVASSLGVSENTVREYLRRAQSIVGGGLSIRAMCLQVSHELATRKRITDRAKWPNQGVLIA